FVLADLSGELEEVIEAGLNRSHQWRIFEAASGYVTKHTRKEFSRKQVEEIDLEKIPASVVDAMTTMRQEEDARFGAFLNSGGADIWIEMMAGSGMLNDDRPDFEPPRPRFARIENPEWLDLNLPTAELRALLKSKLDEAHPSEDDGLFAAVMIPEGILDAPKPGLLQVLGVGPQEVEYWSINQADFDLRDSIRRSLDKELHRRMYATAGLDEKKVKEIQSERVPVKSMDPSKEAGEEEVSLADTIRQYVPIGFVYLLWISLMSVVQMLLNNTVEEKSNRIVEVLLSSVTAGELMAGKLFGIAWVGFTMLFAWIAALLGILHWHAGPEAEFVTKLLEIIEGSGLLWIFLGYFLMAYLLYAGIFLAIGSVCSTIKDAQNFMGPVMIIMMVPLLTMMFIPKDPHGTLATVLSWIPLYTPFVMMNRAAANPPMFDIVGTTILGFVSVVVVIWLAGKVFKTAILRTGQAPRLIELWRWLKG
ncbi:MAG: ABC transporter permease, partial [Planctomycetota bacterium]|nr:ABC transporter permease [Planctomycetota bacterium]